MSKDNVNSPSHYTQAGIECIDAITAAVSGKSGIEAVCVANVIKYLWRYELKNGVEDVKKAQWYLNRLVAELERKPDPKPVPKHDVCNHDWVQAIDSDFRQCIHCGKTEDVYI